MLIQRLLNVTLFQYALVCVAWGICQGAARQIDVGALRHDMQSRTYFVLMTVSFVFTLIVIVVKLVAQQLQTAAVSELHQHLLAALVYTLSAPVLNDGAAVRLYESTSNSIMATEVRVSLLTAVTAFDLALLANAVVFYAVERYGSILLRPLVVFAPGRRAAILRGLARVLVGILTATAAFAVMLTVRRLMFLLLHWPADIRFFF